MTGLELKEQVNKVLGTNIRCILSPYWWKYIFRLIIDFITENKQDLIKDVDERILNISKKVDDTYKNYITIYNGYDKIMEVSADGNKIQVPMYATLNIPFSKSFKVSQDHVTRYNILSHHFTSNPLISAVLMFHYCGDSTIDLSGINTSKCSDFFGMFDRSNIESINTLHLDLSNAERLDQMFDGCYNLKELLFYNVISKVTTLKYTFAGCKSLEYLSIPNMDTSNVNAMDSIFWNLKNLKTLYLGEGFFKTKYVNVIDFSYMKSWTGDSVINSLVDNSFDRAANGLSELTLQLHENTVASLSEEDKAKIIAKGYIIETLNSEF